jgi:folate-binding protein YgfZ
VTTGGAPAGYAAARDAAAWLTRADRAFVRVHGRDPLRMIQGLVTNDVAGAPPDRAVYALLLTPKGKLLADLRVHRRDGELLLESDAAAHANVTDTLRKFVPPIFARFESDTTLGVVGVYGPQSRVLLESLLETPLAQDAPEHASATVPVDGASARVVRTRWAGVDGWDVVAAHDTLAAVRARLEDRAVAPLAPEALEVLRIEAGSPRWGAELTEDVIPLEAGLRESAISETKGCYTGQEVIIRILHRGHVNWHLRGMLLGDAPLPERDTPLLSGEDGRKLGRITSACASPALCQTIALGYGRRELTLPATLRLGRLDGPEVTVVALPFEGAPAAV